MTRRRPSWPALAMLGVAMADSVVASTARPFSWRADITTAAGIVCVAGCGLLGLGRRRRAAATAAARVGPAIWARKPALRAALPWVAVVAAITAFELVNLFASPRRDHPTISSLLVVLTGHEVLRGVLFAIWLGAGWWLWGPL
jgi:hypothetical protein